MGQPEVRLPRPFQIIDITVAIGRHVNKPWILITCSPFVDCPCASKVHEINPCAPSPPTTCILAINQGSSLSIP